MQESPESKSKSWKGKLKGRHWLAGGMFLMVGLTVLVRVCLTLVADDNLDPTTEASPWAAAIGISVGMALVIGLLVWTLSGLRHFRRLIIGVGCSVAVIAIFYVEEDVRGRWAWQKFKTGWEGRGVKFDFAAVIPPLVPDDQNFALAPVVATSYGQTLDRNGQRKIPADITVVNRLQMPVEAGQDGPKNGYGNWQNAVSVNLDGWQSYYRKLSETTNLFPVPRQPGAPAADVLLALSIYDSTVEELRQAAELPSARFPLNYGNEEPFSILLPHLAALKGCARLLQLRAVAELEAGRSEAALADISLAMRLTEKIRSEPFLISHLVRIAMLQITGQAIWEGLAKHRWTDAQLAKLDHQLAEFDFVADYQAAMRGENACQVAGTDFIRHHPAQLFNFVDANAQSPERVQAICARLAPSGWYYQNELTSSRFILEQFVPIGDVARQSFSPSAATNADFLVQKLPVTPYTLLSRLFLPALPRTARKFAVAQANVNLARTACALERYRLAQGEYPASLGALAPQFIATVPHDPIGGQPLHYRIEGSGRFTLYSVGWNEKDDNGTVVLTKNGSVDFDNGDLVWSYPDTPKS